MSVLLLGEQFQVPGIPATMALAAVALIGYLVGRQSRTTVLIDKSADDVKEALADARQLEQITEEMLSATRGALEQCRNLRLHCQPTAKVTAPRASADYVSDAQEASAKRSSVIGRDSRAVDALA